MTEAQARENILNIMRGFVGMSRPAGTHKPIIDKYNSQKALPRGYAVTYNDSYCATTISSAAITAGYTDIIPVECSCPKMVELAQKMGIWVENDAYIPKAGDIILYDWQDGGIGDNRGVPDHIGMVEKVSGNNMTIIEGNMSGGVVGRRTLRINGRYIRGFICPKYDKKATEKTTKKSKVLSKVAKEVISGKFGNGDARKANMKKAGYSESEIKEIQHKVNELLKK